MGFIQGLIMNTNFFSVALLAVFLAGCAATPKMLSEPITVTESELSKYWLWGEIKNEGSWQIMLEDGKCLDYVPAYEPKPSISGANFKIGYLIDSNGKQFDHKLLENNAGEYSHIVTAMQHDSSIRTLNFGSVTVTDEAALVIPGMKIQFTQSASNASKTPVNVSRTISLASAECLDQNPKTAKIDNIKYTYFSDFNELNKDRVEQEVIVFRD